MVMHQKTKHANAMAAAPSAPMRYVATTATPAWTIDTTTTALLASDTQDTDTQDTEMQYTALNHMIHMHQPNSR